VALRRKIKRAVSPLGVPGSLNHVSHRAATTVLDPTGLVR
jgi:hypothetical protein